MNEDLPWFVFEKHTGWEYDMKQVLDAYDPTRQGYRWVKLEYPKSVLMFAVEPQTQQVEIDEMISRVKSEIKDK